MDNVRELPGQDARVETGVVQFGDDWPGIFIRGDNAFAYARHLRALIDNPEDVFGIAAAAGLATLLESCIVGKERSDG